MRAHSLCLLLLTIACGGSGPARAPDYRPVATRPAPPAAALYAGCLAAAAGAGHYRHASDAETSLLVFTCTGEPARAFYDGLAAYSARIGSQFEHAGRTYRSTTRIREDLFGVDYCSTDGTDHACSITLNAGGFLQ